MLFEKTYNTTDKGKPVARRGRKATGLLGDSRATEVGGHAFCWVFVSLGHCQFVLQNRLFEALQLR